MWINLTNTNCVAGEEIAASAIEHGKEAFVRAETAAEDLLGDVKRAVSELVDQGLFWFFKPHSAPFMARLNVLKIFWKCARGLLSNVRKIRLYFFEPAQVMDVLNHFLFANHTRDT